MGSLFSSVEDDTGAKAERASRPVPSCSRRADQPILEFLSRSLNVLTGGSRRELFCSRAYRRRWRMCRHIDAGFRLMRADDREHCRACFLGDKRAGRISAE